MIPGKKYTPEDVLAIFRRRRLAFFVPFVLVAVGTLVVTQFLPDQYRSEASMLVVPQRVPENYVQSAVTTRIEERLQAISQQILSRTRLERIVQDFDLYPDLRKSGIMEDVIEQMRLDINLDIVRSRNSRRDTSSFRVSYTAPEALTAMRVTERLASLFIEENLRDRNVLAEGTNQFLESQLQDARGRLVEHEKTLEEYRRRYAGELPSQVQSNLEMLQTTQLQLQAVTESMSSDADRRLVLERLIADATALELGPPRVPGRGSPGEPASLAVIPAAAQVEAARIVVQALELRLTPEHPDIIRMNRLIEDLERQAEAQALEQPLSPGAPSARPLTPVEVARRTRLTAMRAEAEKLDGQMAQKEAEQERLQGVIAQYHQRVDAAPARESELAELTRDYDTLERVYNNLLSSSEAAKVSANLERRQIGEQFRVIDPARLPEQPFSPNRIRLSLVGVFFGLAAGIGLVALREYRDSSLRTDDDVMVSLALPVLAMIPAVMTTTERRRRRRRNVLVSSTAGASLLLCVGALVWKFELYTRWVY